MTDTPDIVRWGGSGPTDENARTTKQAEKEEREVNGEDAYPE